MKRNSNIVPPNDLRRWIQKDLSLLVNYKLNSVELYCHIFNRTITARISGYCFQWPEIIEVAHNWLFQDGRIYDLDMEGLILVCCIQINMSYFKWRKRNYQKRNKIDRHESVSVADCINYIFNCCMKESKCKSFKPSLQFIPLIWTVHILIWMVICKKSAVKS